MVTFELPVLETDTVMVLPTDSTTLPKLRVAGEGVRNPVELTVAVRGTCNAGFEPLEVTVMVSLIDPPAGGTYCTQKLTLPPGSTLAGKDIPVTENPLPENETPEMVTPTSPVFMTFSMRL